jgi:hypothetical protein
MKNPLLKKTLPHVIAIVLFLVVALLFCKPVLEGNVLNQDDITKWKGIAQNSFDYKEKNGHFPLWNPNIFSGMPNYQVAMESKSVLPDLVKVFTLGLPKPVNFFFLACICFYILCIVLRTRPIIGMIGAIAYAYSTYNAVIIFAGHDTQMLATSFMPLLLSGLILTFEKKYWLGLAITTLGAYMQIGVNHLQISYYFFLIAIAVTIGYLVYWIKRKEWKHIMISGAVIIVAGLTGLAGSALTLMTTAEYTKYTMRGGKSISLEGDTVKTAKTSGLDTAYAFEYSLGKSESFTLLMPNAFGGSSYRKLTDKSNVVTKLNEKGIAETTGQQLAQDLPKYWGELPFTAGPAYLGVFISILGLIGFVIIKTPLRWGLLAVTVLGIILSWGKHFAGFNTFLFEHLPLYNKFRAPSMAQVIPQFAVTIVAMLALQRLLFNEKSREWLQADFKKILYTMGGLFGLLALMYLSLSYSAPYDNEINSNISQQAKSEDIGRAVIQGMKADRRAMFGAQFLRAFGLGILLLGLLYLYMKDKLKPIVVAVAILIIGSIELLVVSKTYLDNDRYVTPDDLEATHFSPDAIEQQILRDTDPNYRVFNTTVNPLFDARTSSFFKSVTGYHPARLRIYQDVLDRYISKTPTPAVLNMLNTKYFIYQNPQTGAPAVIPNPDAYGSCWLAKFVKVVDGPVQEFLALKGTNLKDTVVVDKTCAPSVAPQPDSASNIKLIKFDNDAMEYEANCNGPQFAVFSEVYYPAGWNAYLDEKKVDYCKVNYLLRGLSIPAGKHTIKFVFEPASYKKGVNISFIASILILVFFLGGLFMQWRMDRKPPAVKA